jgi:hypothetical protein
MKVVRLGGVRIMEHREPNDLVASLVLTKHEVDNLVMFIEQHVGWIGHDKEFQRTFTEFSDLLSQVQREANGVKSSFGKGSR